MKNAYKLFCFACLVLGVTLARGSTGDLAGDGSWPREVDSEENHFVIYQPQVDSWQKDHLEARSAVIVTRAGAPKPIYGIVSVSARTEVDKESRMIALQDLKVTSASFPAAPSQQSKLLSAIQQSLPQWPQVISLDRLLADLAIAQAEAQTEAIPLKNEPPKIIFSATPSVLILIEGDPVYRNIEGMRYTRVINTPALLLFDSSQGRFYLDGTNWWMTATSLNGPWAVAVNPPPNLDQIKDQLTQSEQRDPNAHPPQMGPAGLGAPAPAVFVSTTPAELLQTRGDPQYSPIPKTQLLYVTNTENDIFMDVKTQDYYTLPAGRWFQASPFGVPGRGCLETGCRATSLAFQRRALKVPCWLQFQARSRPRSRL